MIYLTMTELIHVAERTLDGVVPVRDHDVSVGELGNVSAIAERISHGSEAR